MCAAHTDNTDKDLGRVLDVLDSYAATKAFVIVKVQKDAKETFCCHNVCSNLSVRIIYNAP